MPEPLARVVGMAAHDRELRPADEPVPPGPPANLTRSALLVDSLARRRESLRRDVSLRACRDARAMLARVADALEEPRWSEDDRRRVLDAWFELDHAIDALCEARSRPRPGARRAEPAAQPAAQRAAIERSAAPPATLPLRGSSARLAAPRRCRGIPRCCLRRAARVALAVAVVGGAVVAVVLL